MPIFAQGVTKDKLSILYFIKTTGLDITREQLYRAMVETDCMDYFDFQPAMHDLEEDGFIAAIPRTFGQGYRVTTIGETSLSLFLESLPHSLRKKLAEYAEANRAQMLEETQLVSSMQEQESGAYLVELKAQERDRVLLTISIQMASRSMAQRIRKNWPAASEDIYADLLERLLGPGDGETEDG